MNISCLIIDNLIKNVVRKQVLKSRLVSYTPQITPQNLPLFIASKQVFFFIFLQFDYINISFADLIITVASK